MLKSCNKGVLISVLLAPHAPGEVCPPELGLPTPPPGESRAPLMEGEGMSPPRRFPVFTCTQKESVRLTICRGNTYDKNKQSKLT
jgi:hypothetical protein